MYDENYFKELSEIILDDIRHIANETSPECSDHQLRRVSTILRRLLIEDDLIKCWKYHIKDRKQPIIVAPRMNTAKLNEEAFAVAGGGQIGGISIAQSSFHPGVSMSDSEIKEMYETEKKYLEYEFTLQEFKDSCGVFVKGKKIKRSQVISYIANKKGGSHLDTKRKKDEENYKTLDENLDLFLFGGELDEKMQQTKKGKNSVYLELLSIGQAISKSKDINELCDLCDQHINK
ncbi:hypothetical protein [Thalassospira povalilytica]|uniref:hypothetical protein n=1 Tax=Thalassospira povalilytica TaxID=732237 RepID=UPI003AA88040